MKEIAIRCAGDTSHTVVGFGAVEQLAAKLPQAPKSVFLIYDEVVAGTISLIQKDLLSQGYLVRSLAVRAGEGFKCQQSVEKIYDFLSRYGADRKSLVVAAGGGTVTDTVGFAAATYMRGLDWFAIPTTLIGQVDAAVGGKTGINRGEAKNFIGAFHNPKVVICDLDFLKTLPKRDFHSGLAEVVKYALIGDIDLFKFLQTRKDHFDDLTRDDLLTLVELSVACKAKVVSQDPHDKAGVRASLNFGHTIGHALESLTDYAYFSHGEAVAIGMRCAIRLSLLVGVLGQEKATSVDELVATIPTPKLPSGLDIDKLWSLLASDKKTENGVPKFVLLSDVGRYRSGMEVMRPCFVQAMREMLPILSNRS